MNNKALIAAISASLTKLTESADELRDLDAALGDGDLGITVMSGSKAVIAALAELDEDATLADIAKASAKAFGNANPSTFAALVTGALLAGSRTLADKTELGPQEAAAFAEAAAESISLRGKSQVGDKTILDALVPAATALRSSDDPAEALDAAIQVADEAATNTASLQSRRGRAAWLQERSIGLQDPGATAFVRFLQAWKSENS